MTNKQINRHLEEFSKSRRDWLEILVENPGHTEAAQHIISINSKMELLRSLWNWGDDSVEMRSLRA